MKDIRGPGDFLAWLGGADLKVLAQVPTERGRFVQMAIVLLTTAGIGSLSMMFALYDGVHTPLAAAIPGGLVWGFIILNLDRFLVMSMGHARDWRRLLLMALPRLALAMVISLVVATPMTLRIFANDINNEMAQVNATESRLVAHQQAQSGPAIQANLMAAKIATDKATLAGHLQGTEGSIAVSAAQQAVNTLKPQVQAAQSAMDKAQAAYQCEVDGSGAGCEGASDLQGKGPMAQLKQTEWQQAEQKYQTLNTELQTAQAALTAGQSAAQKDAGQTLRQQQAAAKAELPGLEKRYSALESQLRSNEAKAQNAVEDNNGILAQLQDLSDAGAQNPMLGVAQWVVTLLFFCIEILPVMVKVLLNLGPLSPYEVVLKNEEHIATDEVKLRRVTKRRDAERQAEKQTAIDEHMRHLEEGLGKKANEHVARHMEAILDAALEQWSRQVQSQLGVQVPPGAVNGQVVSGPGLPGANGSAAASGGPVRRVTGAHPRLGITGPQPAAGNHGKRQTGAGGYQGNGHSGNGWAPTITNLTPAGSGYALPDDEAEDLL
jgi:hypothetical protein